MTKPDKLLQEFEIDKNSWKLTKFSDVAIQNKKIIDRENTNLKKYVKGDHMGSEDLHLRSWGELTDEYLGPAFIRKFDEKDILYGSRRTYLRKVVIAPFSGITSNTTFVIKPNKENINSDLLPFIMLSERFAENSIKNSKGSVNPYINWKDIAKYQFLLPPKKEQTKLAELLWTMDEVIEKQKIVLDKLKILDLSQLNHFFDDYQPSEVKKLKDIVFIKKGKKPPILLKEGDGLPYCTLKYLRTGKYEYIVPQEYSAQLEKIDNNDLLVVWDGNAAGEIMFGKNGIIASTMCSLKVKDKDFLKDYVFQVIRSKESYLRYASIGSAIPHIDPMVFNKIRIPKVNINKQAIITKIFMEIEKSIKASEILILKTKVMQKNLINQIF
jgi:type I restriction enzyme, S subunit